VPVDVYIPGCPPRPEQVLDALVLLQERIQKGEGHSQVVLAAEAAAGKAGGIDVPVASIKPRTAHLPGGES
jgi:NADH:ubiquinone oxidoreductase subunit B-like Fe-S oxidoreductase